MTPTRPAILFLLAGALCGCNQTAGLSTGPDGAAQPTGGPVTALCGQEIDEFKATLADDAGSGKLARDAYRRATSDVRQAEVACQAGRDTQARFIIFSAKKTYGYIS